MILDVGDGQFSVEVLDTFKDCLLAWLGLCTLVSSMPETDAEVAGLGIERMAEYMSVGTKFATIGSDSCRNALKFVMGDTKTDTESEHEKALSFVRNSMESSLADVSTAIYSHAVKAAKATTMVEFLPSSAGLTGCIIPRIELLTVAVAQDSVDEATKSVLTLMAKHHVDTVKLDSVRQLAALRRQEDEVASWTKELELEQLRQGLAALVLMVCNFKLYSRSAAADNIKACSVSQISSALTKVGSHLNAWADLNKTDAEKMERVAEVRGLLMAMMHRASSAICVDVETCANTLNSWVPQWERPVEEWDVATIKRDILTNPQQPKLSTEIAQLATMAENVESLKRVAERFTLHGDGGFMVSDALLLSLQEAMKGAKTAVGIVAVCNYILFRAESAASSKSKAAMVRELTKLLRSEKIKIPDDLNKRMLETTVDAEVEQGGGTPNPKRRSRRA